MDQHRTDTDRTNGMNHGEPDAPRGARPVRRAGWRNPPIEGWKGRSSPTPTPSSAVRSRGRGFFLYAIIGIFSRKLVGWTIAERESETIAASLITTTCRRYGIDRDQLTIHADRGSPMIAHSVRDLLAAMGVTKSHSRPRVSNDNPFIEAQFKTLKYRPDFPDRFAAVATARAWMRRYEHWYNHVHYHFGIGYHRPADLHDGTHHTISARRTETLQRAYQQHPDRFRRPPTPLEVPTIAWINQPTIQTAETAATTT